MLFLFEFSLKNKSNFKEEMADFLDCESLRIQWKSLEYESHRSPLHNRQQLNTLYNKPIKSTQDF
jgi:hypothetical protein